MIGIHRTNMLHHTVQLDTSIADMFVEVELQVGEDQVMFRMGLTVRMPILKVEDIVLVVVTVILLQLNVKGNRIKTNFALLESDGMYIISDRTLYHNSITLFASTFLEVRTEVQPKGLRELTRKNL